MYNCYIITIRCRAHIVILTYLHVVLGEGVQHDDGHARLVACYVIPQHSIVYYVIL